MRQRLLARVVVSFAAILSLLAAAGGIVVVMFVLMRRPPQQESKRIVPMVLAPALEARRDYRVGILGYGSARPLVRLQIVPQVTGQIVSKADNFLTGKYVRKGQVLFEIDKTDYVQARDAAQGQIDLLQTKLDRLKQEQVNLQASEAIELRRLKLARKRLEEVRRLFAAGAAGQTDVDGAEETALMQETQLQSLRNQIALIEPQRRQLLAEKAVAQVQLTQALTSIARATVRSPVTGRVLSRGVEVGERVAVGSVCGELYGTQVMEVPVPIPAGDLAWLEPPSAPASRPAAGRGAPTQVVWHQPDNGQTLQWQGRVARIEAGLAAQTRMATVVVAVANPGFDANDPPETPDPNRPMLDLNMFCQVTILGRKLPTAFILPRRAILPDGSVYVVNSGRLARRKVRVARFAGEEAMLLPGGGLTAGDRVIIGYVPRPVLGMRVRAVDSLRANGAATQAAGAPASAPGAAAGPARR